MGTMRKILLETEYSNPVEANLGEKVPREAVVLRVADTTTEGTMEVEVEEDTWFAYLAARDTALEALKRWLPLEAELIAKYNAAEAAKEAAEEQAEEQAEVEALQALDAELGPRDFVVRGYSDTRKPTIHRATCNRLTDYDSKFTSISRRRAADVPLGGELCPRCKPRKALDAAANWSQRERDRIDAKKAEQEAAKEANADVRPEITHRMVVTFIHKVLGVWWGYQSTTGGYKSEEHTVLWKDNKPGLQGSIGRAAAKGWIITTNDADSNVWVFSKMTPREIEARDAAIKAGEK